MYGCLSLGLVLGSPKLLFSFYAASFCLGIEALASNGLTLPVTIPNQETGIKDLHKTFRGTTKKCENKNLN